MLETTGAFEGFLCGVLVTQLGESPAPAQMCSRAGALGTLQHVVTGTCAHVPCWHSQVPAACAQLRGVRSFVHSSDAGGALKGSSPRGSEVFSGRQSHMAQGQRLHVL